MNDTSIQSLFSPGEAGSYFDIKNPSPLIIDSAFHLWNAWWLAELSRLVYREDKHNQSEERESINTATLLAQNNFELLGEFVADETSTYGMLLKTNGVDPVQQKHSPCLIMVFCGSNEINDWRLNIKAYQKDFFKLGNIHRGFQKAFLSIKDQIMDKQALFEYPLFITGHSLGAALAVLTTAYLGIKSNQIFATYTFGAPKVGGQEFVQSINHHTIHRIVNDCDLVTHLPFELGKINYEHYGENWFLDKNAELLGNLSHDEISSKQSDFPNFIEIFRENGFKDLFSEFQREIPQFLSDHAPVNYVEKLALALNRG